MKIGISAGMIQRGQSGVAQYLFALVRALLARPEAPRVTLFALEEDRSLFEFAEGQVHLHPVPERFRAPVRNIIWHQRELPRLVQQLGLDVLHVPTYRRMLWRKPCPSVATIHDLAPFHVRRKYSRARMFYGRVVARYLARRQDRIIAVSRFTGQDIERFFGIAPDRIEVILNGVDQERFFPGDRVLAQAEVATQFHLDRPFFLYTSRLEHPGKNHVRLIEAFERFKSESNSDWLLALAGGDWHGTEVIRAAARASRFAQDIRFLGFVPDWELPNLYRAAGAMVFPSLFEGFGFPPIEAMACGCPVLSSRKGALEDVVREAAGYLEPDDPKQIASMLGRAASDPAWIARLREAGFHNARRFDWADNAERVLRCYESVVVQSRSKSSLPNARGSVGSKAVL